jgi:hypothetical protein
MLNFLECYVLKLNDPKDFWLHSLTSIGHIYSKMFCDLLLPVRPCTHNSSRKLQLVKWKWGSVKHTEWTTHMHTHTHTLTNNQQRTTYSSTLEHGPISVLQITIDSTKPQRNKYTLQLKSNITQMTNTTELTIHNRHFFTTCFASAHLQLLSYIFDKDWYTKCWNNTIGHYTVYHCSWYKWE